MTDAVADTPSPTRSYTKTLWLIFAAGSVVAAGLHLLSKRMSPSKRGSSIELFHILGTDLQPSSGHQFPDSGVAIIDDDVVVYSVSHFHGSEMKFVPLARTLDDFARVSDILSEDLLTHADWTGPLPSPLRAYEIYSENSEINAQPGLESYLAAIERASEEFWLNENPSMLAYVAHDRENLRMRWKHQRFLWANYTFEWLYLTGLTVLIAWPFVQKTSRRRLAAHAGTVPLAIMLPCYLGYATLSFTSMGPCGGILYPFVALLANAWTKGLFQFLDPFNRIWYDRVPPILQVMSVPQGTPLAISGSGLTGPGQSILLGLIIAGVILSWGTLIRAKTALAEKLKNRVLRRMDDRLSG